MLRVSLTAFLFCFLIKICFGQANECERVYDIVEVMPEYPGGESALRQQFTDIISLDSCLNKVVEYGSKVNFSFIINKQGNAVDPIVTSNWLPSNCIVEIKSKILNMPQWEAGLQGGKPVCVKFVVPAYVHYK